MLKWIKNNRNSVYLPVGGGNINIQRIKGKFVVAGCGEYDSEKAAKEAANVYAMKLIQTSQIQIKKYQLDMEKKIKSIEATIESLDLITKQLPNPNDISFTYQAMYEFSDEFLMWLDDTGIDILLPEDVEAYGLSLEPKRFFVCWDTQEKIQKIAAGSCGGFFDEVGDLLKAYSKVYIFDMVANKPHNAEKEDVSKLLGTVDDKKLVNDILKEEVKYKVKDYWTDSNSFYRALDGLD